MQHLLLNKDLKFNNTMEDTILEVPTTNVCVIRVKLIDVSILDISNSINKLLQQLELD
jgi:hypothetical protein